MDKPAGPTSHDVVARVRRALGLRAVGHTGTLDPFATGLLVILAGRATRLARYVEAERKTYLAAARLGVVTATDDPTGDVVERRADRAPVAAEQVRTALAGFLGPQRQRPPAYSAKHVEGERSYRLARRGETPVLPEVDIVVHGIELVSYAWPDLEFRATVSAGTYLRALGRDLGERLGTGAHLTALRREAIGGLRVDAAVPLAELQPGIALRPPLEVLGHLPRVDLDGDAAREVSFGRSLPAPEGEGPEGPVALVRDGRLVAVARVRDGRLRPEVVLEPAA